MLPKAALRFVGLYALGTSHPIAPKHVALRDLIVAVDSKAVDFFDKYMKAAQIINTYIYPNADANADADADTFRPKNGLIFELQTSRSDEIDQRAEL